jgi:hypothetical protein
MFDVEATDMEGFGEQEALEASYYAEANGEGEMWETGFEAEQDPFLGDVLRKVGRTAWGVAKDPLKDLALKLAQTAGQAVGGQTGGQIAGQIAGQVFREQEMDGEFSGEQEAEAAFEAAGGDMEALDEMNYLAYMAAEAESSAEAEQFIGALLPIAAQVAGPLLGKLGGLFGRKRKRRESEQDPFLGDVLGGLLGESEQEEEQDPFLGSIVSSVVPLITKGLGTLGRNLARNPKTRPLLAALPSVAAQTITGVAKQMEAGREPTPRGIAATMGRSIASTYGNRRTLRGALQSGQSSQSGRGGQMSRGGQMGRSQSWRRSSPRAGGYAGLGGGAGRQQSRIVGYIPVMAARGR